MEQNKKALLTEQANKIAEIVKVLRTQFGEDFEDEVNYLEIVKKVLEDVSAKYIWQTRNILLLGHL